MALNAAIYAYYLKGNLYKALELANEYAQISQQTKDNYGICAEGSFKGMIYYLVSISCPHGPTQPPIIFNETHRKPRPAIHAITTLIFS